MRVLHVVATARRRGAEVFASDLVRALNDEIEQRVVVLRGDGAEVAFDVPSRVLGGGHGVRFDLRAGGELRRLVRGWRPDVVQAHGGEAMKHATVALGGLAVPVVYRRVGLAPSWLGRGPRRAAYGWLMRRAARVVTVGDEVRRETVRLFGVPGSRVMAIPNGVDPGRIAAGIGRAETRRRLGLSPDRPVIASVGGITWEKDPLAHLRVAERALRARGGTHVWVGDGPLRGTLEAEAARRGLDGRLRLLGSRDDVGDLLAAADVLLFASRADGMEGMPAALIEAGMAGVPVAGYAVAGAAEVVVDGRTGLLAGPGDEAALAANASALLEDERRARTLGAAARERCLARFGIAGVASRYLSLYGEVAAS